MPALHKPGRQLTQPQLFFSLVLLLSACTRQPIPITPSPADGCGDGVCASEETSISCPIDCPAETFGGRVELTHVSSEASGEIAVLVASPSQSRYPEGAGVVVVVSPFFGNQIGFQTSPDFTSLGLIQITYLWPGMSDPAWQASSDGTFDHGGELSIQVLQDVLRFASGLQPDTDGRYLVALTPVTPLMDEVGLYASGEAGIAAVNVLWQYSRRLQAVGYLVGREPFTLDSLSALEAGHLDPDGQPVFNPFYTYPGSFSADGLDLNYGNLRWDAAFSTPGSPYSGRPYLDLDSSQSITPADHVFGDQVPVMFGKRYYSTALTQALRDSGSIGRGNWPIDLATPEEAARNWPYRQALPAHFVEMRAQNPDLDIKVMLVFGLKDHAQAALDKPHIHQFFQGFRFMAGQWVRLNPDRAYVEQLLAEGALAFPDNPANTQPEDWLEIGSFAYPEQGLADARLPLAAVAEMADRLHTSRWDENIGQAFFERIPVPTPAP